MYSQLPILSIITYLPLVGALLLLAVPKENKAFIMKAATAIAGIDMVLSLPLWWLYNRADSGFQFVEQASWIPSIGVSYKVGIDGISLLLLLLTTILGFIAILSSWTAITDRVKEYYIYMLLLQVGMMGVFVSLDFFLFYVFWEVMLVPMYFLIGIWGGPRKLYAAIKFFLYTLFGSVLMLLGILAVYFHHGKVTGLYTFDIEALHRMGSWSSPEWLSLQMWVFIAFFIGFAIKVPMFPFHTWLPDAHVEAPTAGSVILAGVLLKMGTYGFIRFSLPLLPDATVKAVPWVGGLAIVGIVYGALVAMAQKDMKKLVAYSSVSHLGFVMLGMFALNPHGLSGSVLQMINHGLSTGGLFLLVGIIYERRHTRMIAEYGGIAKVMPIYAMLFMIITMASIGLPTLNGFIGEFTILIGAFNHSTTWAVIAATGIVLGAAYMLWLYQQVFFGEITIEENKKLKDVNLREQWTLIPLIVMCFWIGLYPKPFFRIMEPSIQRIVRAVDKDYLNRPVAKLPAAPAAHAAEPAEGTGGHGAH